VKYHEEYEKERGTVLHLLEALYFATVTYHKVVRLRLLLVSLVV